MRVALREFEGLVREVLEANLVRDGHVVLPDDDVAERLDGWRGGPPDVILFGRPLVSAQEHPVRALQATHPAVRIVLVCAGGAASAQDTSDIVDAVLPPDTRFYELDRIVRGGRSPRPRASATRAVPWTPDAFLSPRERQVARLLVDGRTSAEIAEALGLSTSTVHSHVQGLLRKLGARDRVDAVHRYLTATSPMDLGAAS